jgi:hypothetical protein
MSGALGALKAALSGATFDDTSQLEAVSVPAGFDAPADA